MNFKSNLVGFAAASVFALSMTTGAMAADTTASVTLNSQNAGVCTLSITDTSITFESQSWDGEVWSNNAKEEDIRGRVTNGKPRQTCDVTAASSGLRNMSEDAEGEIGLTIGTEVMDGTDRLVVNDSATENFTLKAKLGVAGMEDDPGTYQGTVNFKVTTNGQ
ncbi:MAG TPA: hypothetical protein VKZ61_11665 [Thermomicrobiales bacterium]|nr:hypothetical protein [Thermomicrobiales bacterium]